MGAMKYILYVGTWEYGAYSATDQQLIVIY